MTSSISKFLHAVGPRLQAQFDRAAENTRASQRNLLLGLLHRNRNTTYGLKYHFASISSELEYQKRVPIVQYSDIAPLVEDVKAGKTGVLTTEPVKMFALTSGTTAEPKYIPITRRGHRLTEQLTRLWLYRAVANHPAAASGKWLFITGASCEGYTTGEIPFGNFSGMMQSALPARFKKLLAVPEAVFDIADYNLRMYLIARFAIASEVSLIVSPNPLTLAKLLKTITSSADSIISAVHHGWLTDSIRNENEAKEAGISPEIYRLLQPNPQLARGLKSILEKSEELAAVDLWPNLALLGCWLGGSIGYHAAALDLGYKKIPRRDIGYLASEGFFTLSSNDDSPAGPLALNGTYFEFIPLEEEGKSDPYVLMAGEVEPGQSYKLVITNENGLYRYYLDDIVKVESRYSHAPVVSFLQKGSSMLNISGEKLHLNHLLFAMEKVRQLLAVDIRQFRAAPNIQKLRYELFLDIGTGTVNADRLRATLDAALSECNLEYRSRRRSDRLGLPCVHFMSEKWEENMRHHDLKTGKREAQYKWPHLVSEIRPEDCTYVIQTIE